MAAGLRGTCQIVCQGCPGCGLIIIHLWSVGRSPDSMALQRLQGIFDAKMKTSIESDLRPGRLVVSPDNDRF